jgi:hypothetical protein
VKIRNIGLVAGLQLGTVAIVAGLLITQVAIPNIDWNDGAGGMTVIISLFMYGALIVGGYAVVAIGVATVFVSVFGWALAKFYSSLGSEDREKVLRGSLILLVLITGLCALYFY